MTDAGGRTTATSQTGAAAGTGPELGLATAETVDAGGLNLTTTTGGYLASVR